MKKFGIVLPSVIYKPERRALADEAFRTLNLTMTTPFAFDKPMLKIITEGQWPLDLSGIKGFRHEVVDAKNIATGTEQSLAYGTELVIQEGAEYVIWMGDDALFNVDWLMELNFLIDRHPDAFAWSVYRSAYTTYHKPVGESLLDIETQCLCGHGLTFTAAEWKKWGIDWHTGHWPSPAGDTLDLHHSWVRQPEGRTGGRWCTKKSYIEHTGKYGKHTTGVEPEYAIDFQGV